MRSFLKTLFFALLYLAGAHVQGQSTFDDVPKQDAMDCVLGFVKNRESFKNYGCRIDNQQRSTSGSGQRHSKWEATIFEDSQSKLRRSDIGKSGIFLGTDGPESPPGFSTWSTFNVKGKTRYFESNAEFKAERAAQMAMFYAVPDPWMATISEMDLLESGRAGESNYWIVVLDESNLLWAQSNSEFIRGEWKFGSGDGKCYVQVYFANNLEKMPVLVNYILPKDWNAKFATKGKMVSTNVIEWKKQGDGFVPSEIRNKREDYWASRPGIKSSSDGSMTFKWETKYCDGEGIIDPRVFTPKALSVEEIMASFDTSRKRPH